jgi:hypothetical protein
LPSCDISALRIIGVGEIEEIPGCDRYTCSRIDAADRENKTQQEMEK